MPVNHNTIDPFVFVLESNKHWANFSADQIPDYFSKLAKGQSPKYLWIGCSDSRCPETTILSLRPGDVFVHRNIANVVSATDINTSAVIEYAVAQLKVQHVILCGHSCCGGAAAVLSDEPVGDILDMWLAPLRAVRQAHAEELAAAADDAARAVRLAELNVRAGVDVLMANHTIRDAVRDRGLEVHGCLFDLTTGRVRDLRLGTTKESTDARGNLIVRGKHAQLVFRGGNASMSPQ